MHKEELSSPVYSVMTIAEVVARYGITRQAVHDAISRGKIPARQAGRVWLLDRADVEERWRTTG